MRLGVLGMGPFESEVPCLEEISASALAGLVVGKVHRKTTVAFVIYFISGIHIHGP